MYKNLIAENAPSGKKVQFGKHRFFHVLMAINVLIISVLVIVMLISSILKGGISNLSSVNIVGIAIVIVTFGCGIGVVTGWLFRRETLELTDKSVMYKINLFGFSQCVVVEYTSDFYTKLNKNGNILSVCIGNNDKKVIFGRGRITEKDAILLVDDITKISTQL